jgi:ABC-type multidrug transport system fused ATPase/permease subunit
MLPCPRRCAAAAPASSAVPIPDPEDVPWVARQLALYMLPTFRRGLASQVPLALDDLPRTDWGERPVVVAAAHGRGPAGLARVVSSTHLVLWRVLLWFVREDVVPFTLSGLGFVLLTASQALVPWLVEQLLRLLEAVEGAGGGTAASPAPSYSFGYVLAGCMALAFAGQFVGSAVAWLPSNIMGYRSQVVLAAVAATKGVLLAPAARNDGEQQAVFSRYTAILANSSFFGNLHADTWAPAAFVAVAMTNLTALLGPAAWVAFAVQTACTAAAFFSRSYFRAMDRRSNTFAVRRVGLLREALVQMAALRATGWGAWYRRRIERVREEEVDLLRRAQLVKVVVDVAFALMQAAVLIAAFLSYAAFSPDTPLAPAVAFTSITWIAALGSPMKAMPAFIQAIADASAFVGKLQENVARPEVDMGAVQEQWGKATSAQFPRAVAEGTVAGGGAPSGTASPVSRSFIAVAATLRQVLRAAGAEGEPPAAKRPGVGVGAARTREAAAGALAPSLLDADGDGGASSSLSLSRNEHGSGTRDGEVQLALDTLPAALVRGEAVDEGERGRGRGRGGGLGRRAPAAGKGPGTAAADVDEWGRSGDDGASGGDAGGWQPLTWDAVRGGAGTSAPAPGSAHSAALTPTLLPVIVAEHADIGVAATSGLSGGATLLVEDVSFSCLPSTLTVVIGPVGSGKSTLLRALAGDADVLSGTLQVRGCRVAFVGQDPFLQRATVRDNITFESLFRAGWYEEVVAACALADDFARLPDGDSTVLADEGGNVSGGQRARIALARALYMDADVYLLDDVFSALDPGVGDHVWDAAVGGLLLRRRKTVLLATHALHYLARPEVGSILVLGRPAAAAAVSSASAAAAASSPPSSPRSKGDKWIFSREEGASTHSVPARVLATGTYTQLAHIIAEESQRLAASRGTGSVRQTSTAAPGAAPPARAPRPATSVASKIDAQNAKIITWQGIGTYVRSFGSLRGGSLVFLFVASQAAAVAQAWWLKVWAEQDQALYGVEGGNRGAAAVYAAIGAAYVVLTAVRMLVLALATTHAGQVIHNTALASLFAAPMDFFAQRQSGEILNRFERDIDHIDSWVRPNLSIVATAAFSMAGSLSIVAYASPVVLVWVAVVGALFVRIAGLYRRVVMKLRSLDSASNSSAVTYWKELNTRAGAALLRAAGPAAVSLAILRLLDRMESMIRTRIASLAGSTLASMLLAAVGNTVTVVGAVVAVLAHSLGALTAGNVGLLLSSAYAFPSDAANLVQNVGYLEQSGVSIQRIADYVLLESEDDETRRTGVGKGGAVGGAAAPLPPLSPSRGLGGRPSPPGGSGGGAVRLTIRNLGLRYGSDPFAPWALRGLDLDVAPGTKVAVVGRTGAGKSSILQALLRLHPYQEGTIEVGGVDLGALPAAADVRSRMSVLLQSGLIFEGSVRENLLGPRLEDIPVLLAGGRRGSRPVARAADGRAWEDAEILGFLRRTLPSFAAKVSSLPLGLDSEVRSGGENLSKGERALLNVARLLLAQELACGGPGLIILDEPTADVDVESDRILHDVLLGRGGGSGGAGGTQGQGTAATVLAICHRREHLPRFDLVAVIEDGRCTSLLPPGVALAGPLGVGL